MDQVPRQLVRKPWSRVGLYTQLKVIGVDFFSLYLSLTFVSPTAVSPLVLLFFFPFLWKYRLDVGHSCSSRRAKNPFDRSDHHHRRHAGSASTPLAKRRFLFGWLGLRVGASCIAECEPHIQFFSFIHETTGVFTQPQRHVLLPGHRADRYSILPRHVDFKTGNRS